LAHAGLASAVNMEKAENAPAFFKNFRRLLASIEIGFDKCTELPRRHGEKKITIPGYSVPPWHL
jgi:hypothetical protein